MSLIDRARSVLSRPSALRPGPPPPISGLKAEPDAFSERFREVVSDPLNLLVARVPEAGCIDASLCVVLHNGMRVPVRGRDAYYGRFSELLVINRGVHEPLEEFCFQELLRSLERSRQPALMLELGAYWGHYSLWCKRQFPGVSCVLVDPDRHHLDVGRRNFQRNRMEGQFVRAAVGDTGFRLDDYVRESGADRIDILHADIQGAELAMLQGGQRVLSRHIARYVLVSTHSQVLHLSVADALTRLGYRLDVSSDFEHHTTSHDGFLLASAPGEPPLFDGFIPLGRTDMAACSRERLVEYLVHTHQHFAGLGGRL